MKGKKVIIISPEFPPQTNWGGIATHNYHLAKVLKDIGLDVHVIALGTPHKHKKLPGIKVHFVSYSFGNRLLNGIYYWMLSPITKIMFFRWFPLLLFFLEWNLFSLIAFYKLQSKHSFSSIHTPVYHAPAYLISLVFKSIPLFLHLQGPQALFNLYEKKTLDNSLKSWIEKKYLSRGTRCIACSKNIVGEINIANKKSIDKVVYIPNWIETEKYHNKMSVNKHNIVCWGRLEYRKGVDILLRSFKELFDTNHALKLWFVGSDTDTFQIKQSYCSFHDYLNALNISEKCLKNICFVPRFNDRRKLIEFLISKKGIAVFPARYEPFGYVNIEAMALGYVTIASINGGGREIITHEKDGFLVPPKEKQITQALAWVISLSNSKLQNISLAAQKKIRDKYDARIIVGEYRQLYSSFGGTIN